MSDRKLVLSLDIGGTHVRVGVGTRDEGIYAHHAEPWPDSTDPMQDIRFVIHLVREFQSKRAPGQRIYAVGIALAATLGYSGMVVNWPNRPHWRGLEFRRWMSGMLPNPVVIEDDANAAAVAEYTIGVSGGLDHVLVVMAGTGIGAGLILNRQLFRGRHGWAGEFGHMIVQPDGPQCSCGLRGCLQMLASGRALERAAHAQGLADVPALVAAANDGNQPAHEAIVASGRWLGLGVANVVNLLDLEGVVVGGGLLKLGPAWWSAIRESLDANLLNSDMRNVHFQEAALPQHVSLYGAHVLAWQMADSISS